MRTLAALALMLSGCASPDTARLDRLEDALLQLAEDRSAEVVADGAKVGIVVEGPARVVRLPGEVRIQGGTVRPLRAEDVAPVRSE